jgi:hypoxanthine-DNA glycosylase
MPSATSLRKERYYAHKSNHFWKILSDMLGIIPDKDQEVRKKSLTEAGIALWDVIRSCTRPGSQDIDIDNVKVNDIPGFLKEQVTIKAVFLNGRKAEELFVKNFDIRGLPVHYLPSSSARTRMAYETKLEKWEIIKKWL